MDAAIRIPGPTTGRSQSQDRESNEPAPPPVWLRIPDLNAAPQSAIEFPPDSLADADAPTGSPQRSDEWRSPHLRPMIEESTSGPEDAPVAELVATATPAAATSGGPPNPPSNHVLLAKKLAPPLLVLAVVVVVSMFLLFRGKAEPDGSGLVETKTPAGGGNLDFASSPGPWRGPDHPGQSPQQEAPVPFSRESSTGQVAGQSAWPTMEASQPAASGGFSDWPPASEPRTASSDASIVEAARADALTTVAPASMPGSSAWPRVEAPAVANLQGTIQQAPRR